ELAALKEQDKAPGKVAVPALALDEALRTDPAYQKLYTALALAEDEEANIRAVAPNPAEMRRRLDDVRVRRQAVEERIEARRKEVSAAVAIQQQAKAADEQRLGVAKLEQNLTLLKEKERTLAEAAKAKDAEMKRLIGGDQSGKPTTEVEALR